MIISQCQLTLHDFTYYATRELGRLYETEKYLHNYALAYALGLVRSAYCQVEQVPQYVKHLSALNEAGVYITPAKPLRHAFGFHTFKMATVPYYTLTEQTTVNKVLFGRAKELLPDSQFEFFVISQRPLNLPRWVRLGKWLSKAELLVTQQADVAITHSQGEYSAGCLLNPLDVSQELLGFDLIAMPPVSLLANARLRGSYYAFGNRKLPAQMRYTFPTE